MKLALPFSVLFSFPLPFFFFFSLLLRHFLLRARRPFFFLYPTKPFPPCVVAFFCTRDAFRGLNFPFLTGIFVSFVCIAIFQKGPALRGNLLSLR